MSGLYVLVVCTLFAFIRSSRADLCNSTQIMNSTLKQLTRSEILQRIYANYDGKTSPDLNSDGPTNTRVSLSVQSIDSIKESSMDFEIHMYIRQSWVDKRLSYANFSNVSEVTVDPRDQDRIWTPDLYIANEKHASVHQVTVPNRLMRIYSTGRVYYSLRISVTASCQMNLVAFPMDTQECRLLFESYAYSTQDLVFHWDEEEPISIADDIPMPHFDLVHKKLKECMKVFPVANFTCIEVEFHLTRHFGYYLIQIFVPSILVVGLSWVNFWIDMEAVPARVSVGLLTVLTMTTQTVSGRESMPKVSYIKAIDVWMSTCLLFVFAALLEFAVVNVVARRSKYDFNSTSPVENLEKTDLDLYNGRPSIEKMRSRAVLVDKLSRVIFPLSFAFFNILYWPLYIMLSRH